MSFAAGAFGAGIRAGIGGGGGGGGSGSCNEGQRRQYGIKGSKESSGGAKAANSNLGTNEGLVNSPRVTTSYLLQALASSVGYGATTVAQIDRSSAFDEK